MTDHENVGLDSPGWEMLVYNQCLWNVQDSGSDEECSEESSSSPEEDAEFSANEEDGKINP